MRRPFAVPRAVRLRAALAFSTALLAIASGCASSERTSESSNETGVPGDVVREAKTWLGTRYRYGGIDRDGVDCSGFVRAVFERFGVRLPRSTRDMYGAGESIPRKNLRAGDLVFFANTAGRGITHVGICTDRTRFIHASTSRGVVVSSLDERYYAQHYAGARRVLGR